MTIWLCHYNSFWKFTCLINIKKKKKKKIESTYENNHVSRELEYSSFQYTLIQKSITGVFSKQQHQWRWSSNVWKSINWLLSCAVYYKLGAQYIHAPPIITWFVKLFLTHNLYALSSNLTLMLHSHLIPHNESNMLVKVAKQRWYRPNKNMNFDSELSLHSIHTTLFHI